MYRPMCGWCFLSWFFFLLLFLLLLCLSNTRTVGGCPYVTMCSASVISYYNYYYCQFWAYLCQFACLVLCSLQFFLDGGYDALCFVLFFMKNLQLITCHPNLFRVWSVISPSKIKCLVFLCQTVHHSSSSSSSDWMLKSCQPQRVTPGQLS